MGGRRERRRLRGPRPPLARRSPGGPPSADRRFGVRAVVALVVLLGLGVMLGVLGVRSFVRHAAVLDHGVTTNATIDAVRSGRGSPQVDIHFTTTGGDRVSATVHDTSVDVTLAIGGPLAVRYDPTDPAGTVAPAADDMAAVTRWALVLGGVLLIGLVGYSLWWRART